MSNKNEDYEDWDEGDLRDFYIEFGESVLKNEATNEDIVFYDYQREYMRCLNKFIIVIKSRQTGFSYIATWLAFCKALFEKKKVLLVSNCERASRNLMRYVEHFIRCCGDGFVKKVGSGIKSRSSEKLEFDHGGMLMSLPNSARTVRGFHGEVILDEFAFFDNEEEMWTAMMPTLSRGYGITIISTPNGKKGKYYEVWSGGRDCEYAHYTRLEVPYTKCHHIIPHIEKIRKSMDSISFKQEYCCFFVDEATSMFPYKLLRPCINPELRNDISVFDNKKIVFVGIDFAKVHDSTIFIALEKTKKKIIMRYFREFKGDYTQQLNGKGVSINSLLPLIKPTQVLVDATGVGEKLFEDLRNEWGSRLRPVRFTNLLKEKMITDLKVAFEDKSIEIQNNEELIEQLHNLERKKIQGSKNVRYTHPKGKHDDMVWALAMAYHGVMCKSISFSVATKY